MKKYTKITIYIFVTLFFILGIYNIIKAIDLKIFRESNYKIDYSILSKNAKKAISITVDDNKNVYFSNETDIVALTKEGKEERLCSNKDYKIDDILFCDELVYFISNDSIYKLDINSKEIYKYPYKIPFCYKNSRRRLSIFDQYLVITIPSYTNSGISQDDNYDIPSTDIKLSGNNYENDSTSYCKPSGLKSKVGEIVNAKKIGNASVYMMDRKSGEIKLFASGIRAISGIDVDENNDIYCIVTGMEDIGVRPIFDDKDYLYKIEKGKFYGFPDFSGGDYIESSRFRKENIEKEKPLLLNNNASIDMNIKPIYVSSNQGTISSLAIDKKGSILSKGDIIFYDNKENELVVINNIGNMIKKIDLADKSEIKDIVYKDGELYFLDSYHGFIFKMINTNSNNANLPVSFWIFISLISLIILILIITKKIKNIRFKM